ncbi:hypothetical protein ACF09G_36610 [Streptomyces albogriseolus]|uniref:hypothetical protein n=1 Tax=Streptomyces albogriseolus TaxID=1887 RepID=UPI0019B31804|nr:hypothetical protein [Streptomyces sp.]
MASPTLVRPGYRTLLRALLEQNGWLSWGRFEGHYANAAKKVAARMGNTPVSVARSTYMRWANGESTPEGVAQLVLEELFGIDFELLMGPAPDRQVELPGILDVTSRAAAMLVDSKWRTSMLYPTAPVAGVDGAWYLDGLDLLDSTSVAVQMYEATAHFDDDVVAIGPEHYPHIRQFVRPTRRALLLASVDESRDADGEGGLYVLDAAHARRLLAPERPVEMLPIPTAFRLDDVTFAVLRGVLATDNALAADDWPLHAEEQGLEQQLQRERSVYAREAVPGLSQVGSAWLGSRFCSHHAIRWLPKDGAPSALWSRAQIGEEVVPLLLFRQQHWFIDQIQSLAAGGNEPPGMAFCVPEDVVAASPLHERIMLFLALAWLEMRGLVTWVVSEPEYSKIDEFVLVPGEQAVVGTWMRAKDNIWSADVAVRKAQVRDYDLAVRHARAHSVIEGASSGARLRAAVDYLRLDQVWDTLPRRCAELGAYGTVDMLQARSRLIVLDELDQALRFVGRLAA